MDYPDIVAELDDMAASSAAITTFGLTPLTTENRQITAIQFGPTQPSQTPPATVFLLGAHHAREWMTTGVTLGLARWLHEVITTGSDPAMLALLEHTAVVIIPVANPDGYQWTRSDISNERDWRGNRDLTCARGVNLNRNMSATFLESGFYSGFCGDDNWMGTTLAAENDALQSMFTSDAGTHRIAAVVSYHSFADMLLYPPGYKKLTDADGPRCGLNRDFQCFNPDFTLYRDVFGDTHSGLWVDRQSLPPTEFPFYRDHTVALLYGVSGDTGLGVNYAPNFKALSVTPELQSNHWGFYVECEPDPDGLIDSTARDQRDVLRRVVSAAPGLVTQVKAEAWGPNNVGTYASGLWTREYHSSSGQDTARARFTKSVWAPADTGQLTATIDTVSHNYAPGRPGAEYNLYFLDHGEAFDSLTLPCEIVSENEQGQSTDSAPECEDKLDLCDPVRLPSNGFNFREDDLLRGGVRDCWWEATSNAELLIPATVPRHADSTHCHLTFSMQWSSLDGTISVERLSGGQWERISAVNPDQPYFQNYPEAERLHSYAFESNTDLPNRTQPFRIQLLGDAGFVRVFDPVVYCRSGGLP